LEKNPKKTESKTITAIYNYSNFVLTNSMSKIPNRSLNFCLRPNNLNVTTEMLVDYGKFDKKNVMEGIF
jgi:hypothetical protein